MKNLIYYFSKLIYKLQIPSCKNCKFEYPVHINPRTNLINVNVGRYTYIGANNTMENVDIGSFCSIGSYVTVGGGVHPTDRLTLSTIFYDNNNCFRNRDFINGIEVNQPKTIIGNDVWIGDQSYIKAGVIIGDGVIVGAHSVITHNIPPYAIVAGVPARIIRYRFNQDVIKKLLEVQWWKWSDDMIKRNKEYLSTIEGIMKL